MSIVQNLKRALGFSEADEEAELQALANAEENLSAGGIVSPFTRQAQPRSVETGQPMPQLVEGDSVDPFGVTTSPVAAESVTTIDDPSLSSDLFDAVIELVNSQLPPMVSAGINTEAQRQYIFSSLDDGLRRRLSSAISSGQWVDERARLLAEIDRLKTDNASVDKLKTEMESLRLSAGRQKRALCDRATDLEMKSEELTRLNDKLSIENVRLVGQLKRAGIKPDVNSTDEDPEIADLKSQIATCKATISELTDANRRLVEENRVWKTDVETLRSKIEIGDTMLNDTRNRLARTRKELDTLKTSIGRADELQARVDELTGLLAAANDKLAAANDKLEQTGKELEAARRAEAEPARRRRRSTTKKKPKVSAIDETSTDTSWLVAEPPADLEPSPKPKDDADFGYQEPKRKSIPDNDRQMSLF